MKTEIKSIMEKHGSGAKLGTEEIRALMHYCIEQLDDIDTLTKQSIARAHRLLGEQYKLAA